MTHLQSFHAMLVIFLTFHGLMSVGTPLQAQDQPTTGSTTNDNPPGVRFAVIGDFGLDNWKPKTSAKPDGSATAQRNPHEAAVAKLVKSWRPDFVVTTGDNNYPSGEASTIDENIGKYYAEFIGDYHGTYGPGSKENRFFPVLGNHDWYATKVGCQAHLDYFSLPGNERYYEFQRGPIHFFMLDNDDHEPDGIKPGTKQHDWFVAAIAKSTAPFQIVVAHHPPYSSGEHGDDKTAQWDYARYGVDLVLCGHDHNYERIEREGVIYIVNGAGGANLRRIRNKVTGSLVRYHEKHGAMLFETSNEKDGGVNLTAKFVNVDDEEVDRFTLRRQPDSVKP